MANMSSVGLHSYRVRAWQVIIPCLVIAFVTFLPQLNFWHVRTEQWHGSFYSYHPDEYPYAAYVSRLILKQPRRNDPYTGKADGPGSRLEESILSIQFVPAYAVAIPARLTGVSVETAFIIMTPLLAFVSAFLVFSLVARVTGVREAAATSVMIVFCLGSLARGWWLVTLFGGRGLPPIPFPFARRYEPLLPFPLFFIFCFCLWIVLTCSRLRTMYLSVAAATATFAVLLFSYYFLWTGALALLLSLLFVLLISRPTGYKTASVRFGLLLLFCGLTLVPYVWLLSHRHQSIDVHTAVTLTHAPDLRPVCLFTLALVAVLIGLIKGSLVSKTHASLFTLSLALAPMVMLNQQVITGRSVQPLHYELFIANYVFLLAGSLTLGLLVRNMRSKLAKPLLVAMSLACLAAGLTEARLASTVNVNTLVDDFMPVATRLTEISEDQRQTALVIHSAPQLTDVVPALAPVAVLWAPHLFTFTGSTPLEVKERYFQYLYYSNVGVSTIRESRISRFIFVQNVFGWDRAIPGLTVNWQPVTDEELSLALQEYASFVSLFDEEHARRYQLSFLIVPSKLSVDLSRVDRWYERYDGEAIGNFLLYRLRPRQKS